MDAVDKFGVSVLVFFLIFLAITIGYCVTHPPYIYVKSLPNGHFAVFQYRPMDSDWQVSGEFDTAEEAQSFSRNVIIIHN